jgi:hypothetical protein
MPGRVRPAAARIAPSARLEAAHGVRPEWTGWPHDVVIWCRAEVTTAELLNAAQSTGSRGLRSLKLSTRAALGVCPGRPCGRGGQGLLARTSGDLFDGGRTAALVRLSELAADLVPSREESG